MKPTPPRFTQADGERAHDAWGANCGPGAIAAICGLTLDELRPQLGDFEQKGYTNPTLMFDTLRRLGVTWWHRRDKDWPEWGLVRVQWSGPWTNKGVPPAAAYRYTHWVGGCRHIPHESAPLEIGVFDINALSNGNGWARLADWEQIQVPLLVEDIPRADGKWWITHVIEIERPAATMPAARSAAPEATAHREAMSESAARSKT